jgi:hypothetical protein
LLLTRFRLDFDSFAMATASGDRETPYSGANSFARLKRSARAYPGGKSNDGGRGGEAAELLPRVEHEAVRGRWRGFNHSFSSG